MGALIAVRREYGDYYLLKEYVGTGPHIVQGSPAQNAAAFQAPVLIFHGTMDSNVRIEQSKLMDAKLKAAGKRSELVIFDGLNHQLDDSTARATLLQRSADFLLAAGK
jgi:dipeptidyl aminopeptidase/acylaminoacyl peptidase